MTFQAIVLADGLGPSMYSRVPTMLHEIAGKRIIDHIWTALHRVATIQQVTVVGRKHDDSSANIQDVLPASITFIEATSDENEIKAIRQLPESVPSENVLILEGSRPLVTDKTLTELINFHVDGERVASWLCESTALFAFATPLLVQKLQTGHNYSLQKQLEELCAYAEKEGVGACFEVDDISEFLEVETRVDLARATSLMRKRINDSLMKASVQLIDPANTYIDAAVTVGVDAIIHPAVILQGDTQIGANCVIGPNAVIRNSLVEGDCTIESSAVIEGSTVGHHSIVGTQVHLSEGTYEL